MYRSGSKVDAEITNEEYFFIRFKWPNPATAQHGRSSGEQFDVTEWLHHVRISAEFESSGLVYLRIANRQHDNRYIGVQTNTATYLESIHVWQPYVKNDDVRMFATKQVKTSHAGMGSDDFDVGPAKIETQGNNLDYVCVIINYESLHYLILLSRVSPTHVI